MLEPEGRSTAPAAIKGLNRLAKKHGIKLRQSYERVGVIELGVRREGYVLRLNRGVHRDARHILGSDRACLVGDAQAFGEKQIELACEPFAPMRQVRALMRKAVLEELLSGEILEIGIVDPAFARPFP